MHSATSFLRRNLLDRLSVAMLALVGAVLVLLLAAHVVQCADESDNHGLVRAARSTERLLDLATMHLEPEAGKATGSDGKSQVDAAITALALLVLAISALLFQRADGMPLQLASTRNTALAHRKLSALLI